MRVDIETVSPLTAGQTVCDIYHMSHLPKNVGVAKVTTPLVLLFGSAILFTSLTAWTARSRNSESRIHVILIYDGLSFYLVCVDG